MDKIIIPQRGPEKKLVLINPSILGKANSKDTWLETSI